MAARPDRRCRGRAAAAALCGLALLVAVLAVPALAQPTRPAVDLPAGVPVVVFGGPEALEIASRNGVLSFDVELALDDTQRARGLMYRKAMRDGTGMLFDFGVEREVAMWMQNTYVSLDMLFIRADGRILRIAEATTPLSTATVSSGGPVRFVLELPAGSARKLGIAAGDRVGHRLIGRR